jgi:hypothetical protein
MRCKTERGDREDRDDVLTRMGDERNRLESKSQRRRISFQERRRCSTPGGAGGSGCRAAACAQQGRRAAGGARGLGPALLWARARGHTRLAAAAMAAGRMGPARPARAGRADRVGPPGSAR